MTGFAGLANMTAILTGTAPAVPGQKLKPKPGPKPKKYRTTITPMADLVELTKSGTYEERRKMIEKLKPTDKPSFPRNEELVSRIEAASERAGTKRPFRKHPKLDATLAAAWHWYGTSAFTIRELLSYILTEHPEIDISPQQIYYIVDRALKLGLLEQEGTPARGNPAYYLMPKEPVPAHTLALAALDMPFQSRTQILFFAAFEKFGLDPFRPVDLYSLIYGSGASQAEKGFVRHSLIGASRIGFIERVKIPFEDVHYKFIAAVASENDCPMSVPTC